MATSWLATSGAASKVGSDAGTQPPARLWVIRCLGMPGMLER